MRKICNSSTTSPLPAPFLCSYEGQLLAGAVEPQLNRFLGYKDETFKRVHVPLTSVQLFAAGPCDANGRDKIRGSSQTTLAVKWLLVLHCYGVREIISVPWEGST